MTGGEVPDQEVSDFVLTETDQGQPQWTLYARYAATFSARNITTARGNVVLQSTEGTRMSTQTMSFRNREQKIVSDDFVRVERAGDVLTGYGFESDPELHHFEFKRQVNATVRTRTGGLVGTERRK